MKRIIRKSNLNKAVFILLIISILLNIFFVGSWASNNARKQEYFIYNLNQKLYELNLAINKQKENDWQDPQVLINQIEKIRVVIVDSVITNNFASSVLNNGEKEMLRRIFNFLEPLPKTDLFEVEEWDEADTEYIIRIGKVLSLSNYTTNSFPKQNWNTIVKQWEQLDKSLAIEFNQ
ncbi:hypothetical protein ACM1TL_03900 [Lysinibacillus capsici]|uniref:hypothetical protein n=1 Tax=Lysinibacillus capsici TaxID=2115968 RepID=UPI0039FD0AC2